MAFTLRSPAFRDGDSMPKRFTADGENLSPPLEWRDPPSDTKSFALIVEDPDAPNGIFRHWGLYNIMPDRNILPEGVEHGVKTEQLGHARNDFGHLRYDGPAPPKGRGAHHYHFKLAALDVEKLSQAPDLSVAELWEEARRHMIGEADLVGTYAR